MLRTYLLLVSTLCSQPLFAGVTIDDTRIIFPSNAKSISVQLRNGVSTPALVQTWIDDGDINEIADADKIPFILTPPLTRVEPHKGRLSVFSQLVLLAYRKTVNPYSGSIC